MYGERSNYACNWHHERGSSVCAVTLRQAIGDVEWSLADYLVSTLLTEQVIEEIMDEAREALELQFKATAKDTSVLETELSRLRSEQRNLATAVATGGDAIPELVMELKRRNERIRLLEADVAAAKRSPQMAAEMLAQAEGRVRKKVENLRETLLATQGDTRDVFQEVLRDGVELEEAEINEESGRTRRVWRIRGSATLDAFSLDCDPTGT